MEDGDLAPLSAAARVLHATPTLTDGHEEQNQPEAHLGIGFKELAGCCASLGLSRTH